jgi:hypothetical protein
VKTFKSYKNVKKSIKYDGEKFEEDSNKWGARGAEGVKADRTRT